MPRKIKGLSEIGKRVERLLEDKSFAWLASEIGVDGNTLRNNLKNGANPKTHLLKKIADCFGKTLDELIHGDNVFDISNTSEDNSGGHQTKYDKLEEGILEEAQVWLDQMEKVRPGQKIWFRIEFENRFPEFTEWKQKKRASGDS